MAQYGIPYMGSKSKIAEWVISQIPPATHFYDLFGGGFSITHAMLMKRKKDFKFFHFNEIRPGICQLIQDAIQGKYNYENFLPEWISKERFFQLKESDPYIKMCWSFGNDGQTYMFSPEIEPYKRSMHQAVVFNEFDDLSKKVFGFECFKEGYSINQRRLFLFNKIEFYRLNGIPDFLLPFLSEDNLKILDRLERLTRLQGLEQLQRLQRLQKLNGLKDKNLSHLNFSCKSYEEVEIKDDSIIYCDPPYANTKGYDKNKFFNSTEFFDWAANHKTPILISQYEIRDSRFKIIAAKQKRSMLNSKKDFCVHKSERLYANPSFQKKYL